MGPVVTRYGHDAVIYPDLRGNPLVDRWLAEEGEEALPEGAWRRNGSFASLLPATFTALVPYGGQGHLLPLETLARQCQEKVQQRWDELAALVEDWLMKEVGLGPGGHWRRIWARQQQGVIRVHWTAVAWEWPEPVGSAASLRGIPLPAQRRARRAEDCEEDRRRLEARARRLRPWMPHADWDHYERTREVFAHACLSFLQNERGFDYAPTHHLLAARHALVKGQTPPAPTADEPGQKCTCCGRRQALTDSTATGVGEALRAARDFWSREALDPDALGRERLCGVCTLKRFLVPAGYDRTQGRLSGLNPSWAGFATPPGEVLDRDGDRLRVPFPSTATLAAQGFIARVLKNPALTPQVSRVVSAHRDAGLPATSFPRALPRLAALAADRGPGEGRRFLELEAEETLFPEAVDGMIRDPRIQERSKQQALEELGRAIRALRRAAQAENMAPPAKRIAVLMMDGDAMGRLLLGDRERIGARWRDVLHPKAVAALEDHPQGAESGWRGLLDAPRLMGPSLHAFINRALARFSHQIVPWVVEREFSGRLIYAGGDDLLCLVPGDEALDLAARLQQLFSAPWVIDTQPGETAWAWRARDWRGPYDQDGARRRFLIPRFSDPEAIRLPIPGPDQAIPHCCIDEGQGLPAFPAQGDLFPLLGPAQSLSAGIAFAHFKTPLSQLLHQARHLLEDRAKTLPGKAALALSHASRNGVKSEFALPWGNLDGRPQAQYLLHEVIGGFAKTGGLPARLPYKLRERAPLVAEMFSRIEDQKVRDRRET